MIAIVGQPARRIDGDTVVRVGPDALFIMVMRDDTSHTVRHLAAAVTPSGRLPAAADLAAVREGYRRFRADLHRALRRAIARPAALHVVDAARLEATVRRRVGGRRSVSLDPLVHGDAALDLSRGFRLGGREWAGLVNRPGAPVLTHQLAGLRRRLEGKRLVLVEDDICSGTTVTQAIALLRRACLEVVEVVPGIRVALEGRADELAGVPVRPVVDYRITGAAGVELTDPRNYLLGGSGLVVRLPAGGWGRAPYWLPFVSTAARTCIEPDLEVRFAADMVAANARFFANLERATGRRVRVGDLAPAVHRTLVSLGWATSTTPVNDALTALGRDLATVTMDGRIGANVA